MFKRKIIKEACIGSYEDAKKIIEEKYDKIDRFETCSNLNQSGFTPDINVFKYIQESGIDQVVMIRNNDTFLIEEDDIEELKNQINVFLNLGAKNFIFGYITKENKVDIDTCITLINEIKQKENTTWSFHMAIDQVDDYFQEINTLINLNFTRILTKGGKQEAIQNLKTLKKINNHFGKKIQIIVGGKVTKDNYKKIYKKTKITQFHGTKIV